MTNTRPELPEPIGATYTIAGSSPAVPERQDLIRPEDLFVCGQMGASITRVTLESSPSKEQVLAYIAADRASGSSPDVPEEKK